jgi:hypothetical protein
MPDNGLSRLMDIINKSILYTYKIQYANNSPYNTSEFAEVEMTSKGPRLYLGPDTKIACVSKTKCLSVDYLPYVYVNWFTEGPHGSVYTFIIKGIPIGLFSDEASFMDMLTPEERTFMNKYLDALHGHFVKNMLRAVPAESMAPVNAAPPRIRWANKSVVREYNRAAAPSTVRDETNLQMNTKRGGGRAGGRK